MADDQVRRGSGAFVAWVLVVGLLAAVFWLASERNARRWYLTAEGGQLVVARGRMFPTGTRPVTPAEAEGKAYAPIPVPAGAKAAEGEFDDRLALDRALFDQLLPWAKAAAEKTDAQSQATAMALADRASELQGLSAAQHDQLAALRRDLAYWSALNETRQAAALVESARRKLAFAQQQGGGHASAAALLAEQLARAATELTARSTPMPEQARPDGGVAEGSVADGGSHDVQR